MPGFWLGLIQLAWLHDRAAEHLPELHAGCATGLLHIQRPWQLQQLHHVLKNLLLHGCLLVGNVAAARGFGNGTCGRAGWATAALEYVEAPRSEWV